MKVEKINESKAVIILTKSDLKKRKISISDLKEGKKKAQDFFFEILEEVNIIDSFSYEDSQLFVEVAISPDDSFIITITKTESIPDIALDSNLNKAKIIYSISSTLYEFKSLDDLYKFSKVADKLNLYIGSNSLYKLDGKHFLLFSKSTVKKADFIKTYLVLCEYSEQIYAKQDLIFDEYANEIIAKDALQFISKI